MSAEVACPRCPAGPFTEPGRLAGHLVEVHLQSPAAALYDARAAFGPAPVTTAPVVTPPKEATMAKKKRTMTCKKCGKPGHIAKTCGRQSAAAAPKPPTTKTKGPRRARRAAPAIAGASNGAPDLVAKAQADAKAMVAQKLNEEILWAEAYLAELRRRAAS